MLLAAQQRASAKTFSSTRSSQCVANGALHRTQRTKLRAAPQAGTTTAIPAPPAELLDAVEKLMQIRTAKGPEEELAAQLAVVEKLSAEAGTNKVFQSINNGSFRTRTVAGRLAELGSRPISFAELSFNNYKPANQMVMPITQDFASLTKGPFAGYESGYVVHASFTVIDVGVEGVHSAIATYSQDPENEQRLNIAFEALRLAPVVKQPGDLEKWLEALKPHNPNMGDDGVLMVDLPKHKGTLDHLLMTDKYHLVRGNMGSVTLLERE